jgi:hypothetical protein
LAHRHPLNRHNPDAVFVDGIGWGVHDCLNRLGERIAKCLQVE